MDRGGKETKSHRSQLLPSLLSKVKLPLQSQYQISHWAETHCAKCSRAAAQGVTPVCWHASMRCWNRKCMVQQHTNAWYGYLMRAEWVTAATLKTDLVWDTSTHTTLAQSSLTTIASFSLPPEEHFSHLLINDCHEFAVQIHWKGTRYSSCITSVLVLSVPLSLSNFCCCTFKARHAPLNTSVKLQSYD